ncbi:MAG: aspartate--tRNA(Asn) ligase [Firmicutes bacterium]|nr:aspartate--tRNA(Asn) ligase [Bacillota bacterium]
MKFLSAKKIKDTECLENIVADYQNGKLKKDDIVTFKAFIFNLRIKANFSFVLVRNQKRIFQCFFSPSDCPFDLTTLLEESSVKITGKIVPDSPCKINPGFEIAITNIEVLSMPPEQPYAIYKSIEQLNWQDDMVFNDRQLTLRQPYYRSIIKIASGVLRGFRDFMISEGFTEFIPPKIVQAGAEGGADMFEIDYFEKKAYLTQSPQMYKQAMVGIFSKVFCVSPVFRAEKHSTSRHINEFEGLDLEMGFIDSMDDLMALQTRMMAFIFDFLNKEYAFELGELKVTLPKIEKIPQVKFSEIKEIIAKEYNRPYRDEFDLEPEEEKLIGKYFIEKYDSPFVFITHYPSEKRPFYTMDCPKNPNTTLSFDLLLNGAEITTGGQRIHDYNAQITKMKAREMNPEHFADYLAMHKFGLPPHGGLGIGLERFVMKILNLQNIKYATCFPRDRDRLTP